LYNFSVKERNQQSLRLNYLLALLFGLIHGMGFANTIRFMLAKDQGIALPLISFNVGLEAGQIALVSVLILVGYLVIQKIGFKQKWWIWALSGISIIIAINMAADRWPL
jgi:hypothetical protein